MRQNPVTMMTRTTLLSLVLASLLTACSAPARFLAVPERQSAKATLPGLDRMRYVVGNPKDMEQLSLDVADTWLRERLWLTQQGRPTHPLPTSNILALSGGGDNGAFGAGLLNGWTASGTRPEFLLVTGVSTGALIAPFAFLGSAYDSQLRTLYTQTRREDILQTRYWWSVLTNDAVADTAPLRVQLRKYINRAFLDAVAAEYAKGRELWISTTNLDSRQRVIWNMTRLATNQNPRAVTLFQDVMLASAAIPGAFPPVMIDVDVNGEKHQEMHVDGGTTAQVFVYPTNVLLGKLSQEHDGERERHLYVVMNARLDPDWAQTERRVISIAERAISSLIHTQGVGDLYRIYLTAQRDAVEFHLSFIPSDFRPLHPQVFDTQYMQALFDRGYAMAKDGYPWETLPPGF